MFKQEKVRGNEEGIEFSDYQVEQRSEKTKEVTKSLTIKLKKVRENGESGKFSDYQVEKVRENREEVKVSERQNFNYRSRVEFSIPPSQNVTKNSQNC